MARLVNKLFATGLFNNLPDNYVKSREDQDQIDSNIKDYKQKGQKLEESLEKKQDKLSNNSRLTDTDIKRYESEIKVLKDKIALNDQNIKGSQAQLTGNNEQFRRSMENAIDINSRLTDDIKISNDMKRDSEQEKLERQATRNNLNNIEDKMRNQQNKKFIDKSRKFSRSGYNDEHEKIITLLLDLREAKNTRNKESILHRLENISKNINDDKIITLISSLVTELRSISINDSQYDQIISDTIETMKSDNITRMFSDRSIKAITKFYNNPRQDYGIISGLRQAGRGLVNATTDTANNVATGVGNAYNSLATGANNAYNNVATGIGTAYNNAVNSAKRAYYRLTEPELYNKLSAQYTNPEQYMQQAIADRDRAQWEHQNNANIMAGKGGTITNGNQMDAVINQYQNKQLAAQDDIIREKINKGELNGKDYYMDKDGHFQKFPTYNPPQPNPIPPQPAVNQEPQRRVMSPEEAENLDPYQYSGQDKDQYISDALNNDYSIKHGQGGMITNGNQMDSVIEQYMKNNGIQPALVDEI